MSQHGDDTRDQGRGHPTAGRRSVGLRVFQWTAAVLAVVLVVASLTAYLKFRSVWNSITRVPVSGLGHQPPKYTSAMNILLIGSDTRSGANRHFGAEVTGQRSDTIIILHIAPNHRGVVVLSIPRDSVVPVLSCPPEEGTPGQQAQPGQVEQINATFADGGPGCLWKTVEQTTHLHLDHFIELNFTGFEKVIDDIGGVTICLPFPVNDPLSRLHLSKGRHHVYGSEALAFWRARYIGEGSDLQRIRRDQYLMASLLQGVAHSDLVSSPSRILSVITDAARSMTTDAGLSLSTMVSIVDSLRSLRPGVVQFIELPTVPYAQNPNWVSWPASDAALFAAIAHDQAVGPARKPAPVAVRTPSASHAPAAATSPQAVHHESAVGKASPKPHTGRPKNLAGNYGGITGGANVCNDKSAFSGPRGGS